MGYAALIMLLITALSTLTQCKKAIEDLVNPKGTIKFINPTFTTIDITFNGETTVILPGGSASFTGTAGVSATGNASTSGKNSIGNRLGLLMTWGIIEVFPSGGGTLDYTLNVGSDYFYLKIKNISTKTIDKVYSNYGTAAQTIDYLSLPNNGTTYDIGYYQAFINSNVRLESTTTFWYWNTLGLSFSNNQQITLTAN